MQAEVQTLAVKGTASGDRKTKFPGPKADRDNVEISYQILNG